MYSASLTQLVIHQDSHAYRVGTEDPNSPVAPPSLSRRHVSAPRTAHHSGSLEKGRDQYSSDLAGLFQISRVSARYFPCIF